MASSGERHAGPHRGSRSDRRWRIGLGAEHHGQRLTFDCQRQRGAGDAWDGRTVERILGALGPTIVGSLVAVTGSYPEALAIISLIYLIGLPTIWLAPET